MGIIGPEILVFWPKLTIFVPILMARFIYLCSGGRPISSLPTTSLYHMWNVASACRRSSAGDQRLLKNLIEKVYRKSCSLHEMMQQITVLNIYKASLDTFGAMIGRSMYHMWNVASACRRSSAGDQTEVA